MSAGAERRVLARVRYARAHIGVETLIAGPGRTYPAAGMMLGLTAPCSPRLLPDADSPEVTRLGAGITFAGKAGWCGGIFAPQNESGIV